MKIAKILASISAIFLMTVSIASAELLFEENFEAENWKDNWTVSSTPAMRTDYVMSGDKALLWKNSNTLINSEIEFGNHVYEVWMYDPVVTPGTNYGGSMLFGVRYNEGGFCRMGPKNGAYNGQYIWGNKSTGDDVTSNSSVSAVKRTNGWHQFVIDLTGSPKAVFYIDGVKVGERNSASAGTIKDLHITSWHNGGDYAIDDIRVWESIDEVPAYENGKITVEDSDGVSISNPEITVEFKDAMNIESFADKVKLTQKDGGTVEVEITEITEASFKVVPKTELEYEKEYILTLSRDVRTKQFNQRLKSDVTAEFTTELNPFQIFDYGFKNSEGEVVDEFTTGDLTLTASFTNKQEIDIPVTLFLMLYEVKDGKLLKCDAAFKTAVLNNNYDTVTLDCNTVTVPEDGEYVLKGFLWSELEEKKVLKKCISFSNEGTMPPEEEGDGEELDTADFDEIVITDFLDNKKAAVTITFDDADYEAAEFYDGLFEKYNLRGTAMLVADWVEEDKISDWKKLLENGNMDFGNHSMSHQLKYDEGTITETQLKEDITGGYEKIKEMFPTAEIMTFASPYTRKTTAAITEMKKNHYANRGGGSGFADPLPSESTLFDLPGYVVLNTNSADDLNSKIDSAITEHKWFIHMLHGVGDGTYNIKESVCDEHFKYIGSKSDDVWVGTFNEVVKYIYEHKNANAEYEWIKENAMSIVLTDSLDDEIFDFPVTLKVNVPADWNGAEYSQDGTETVDVVTENGEKYVYINAVPDKGSILIEKN